MSTLHFIPKIDKDVKQKLTGKWEKERDAGSLFFFVCFSKLQKSHRKLILLIKSQKPEKLISRQEKKTDHGGKVQYPGQWHCALGCKTKSEFVHTFDIDIGY